MQKIKKTTQKQLNTVLVIFIIAILAFVSVVYALFFYDQNLEFQGKGKVIEVTAESLNFSSNEFSGKGSKISKTVKIANSNSGVPVRYSIKIDVTKSTNKELGLERAILLYIDGVLHGTLNSGVTNIEMQSPLYQNDEISHTIELEYHIGASSYFADKGFDIKVDLIAKSMDVSDYIFIKNTSDLQKVLTNSKYNGRTIALTSDLIVYTDLIATNLVNIDLNGHKLTIDNTAKLSFASNDAVGLYKIFDSKQSQTSAITGSIDFDSPNAFVLCPFPNINFINYNSSLLSTEFDSYVKKQLAYGVQTEIDILNNFNSLPINVVFNGDENNFVEFANGKIKTKKNSTEIDRRLTASIEIGEHITSIDFTVRGNNDESILLDILQTNVPHLTTEALTNANPIRQIISGGIFLPQLSLDKNSVIDWECSREDVLNKDGVFNRPLIDTDFELSAIVTFNNRTYIFVYYLTAKGQDANERLLKFKLDNSPIEFTVVGESKDLPIVSDYAVLGFSNLVFSSPKDKSNNDLIADGIFIFNQDFSNLTLNSYTILNQATLDFSVDIDGITFNSTLDIKIDIVQSLSIFDATFNYVLESTKDLDKNTLSGFNLPNEYSNNSVSIVYELVNGNLGIISDNKTYINPNNLTDYVSMQIGSVGESSFSFFTIDPYKLPIQNTECYIKMSITYAGETQVRAIPFSVAGVLHNTESDIDDISLYYALQKKYDTNNDSFITRDEIEQVQQTQKETEGIISLDISKKDISSIKGIEYLSNLEQLNLSYNFINNLSYLSALNNLEILNLSNNKIESVSDIAKLLNLKELALNNNSIKNIDDLIKLTGLEKFYVFNNASLAYFDVIRVFAKMTTFHAYNCAGANEGNTLYGDNENNFITAYQNAKALKDEIDFIISNKAYAPSEDMLKLNIAINLIKPIYVFADVIYLPHQFTYENVEYTISWSTNNANIIKIDNSTNGASATIKQPIADSNIKIYAQIKINANSSTVKRAFTVLSIMGDYPEVKVYTSANTYINALTEIPDPSLRLALFNQFDKNNDGMIDWSEMQLNLDNQILDFTSINIQSLNGLQYFSSIRSIDLRGNNINNYSILNQSNITSLYIDGTPDFSQIKSITSLAHLNITGATNANDTSTIAILLDMINVSHTNIFIFKDINKGLWDPYLESMAKALTSLDGYYMLAFGQTINLPSQVTVKYYGNDITMNITFSANSQDIITVIDNNMTFNATTGRLSKDDYTQITATIVSPSNGKTALRKITVMCLADRDFYLKTTDGKYIPLEEAFPNHTARKIVLGKYLNLVEDGKKIINQADIGGTDKNKAITSIEFSGGESVSLKGLEYLSPTWLTHLTIGNYRPFGKDESLVDTLKIFTKLTNFTVRASVFDLNDLYLNKDLISLSAENCLKVEWDNFTYTNDKNVVVSSYILKELTKLTTFNLTSSNVRDFSSLQFISSSSCENMKLYGNPASSDPKTSEYLFTAFTKLTSAKQVTSQYYLLSEKALWKPSAVGDTSIYKNGTEFCGVGEHRVNYLNPSDILTLPTHTEKGETITWRSSTQALIINNATKSASVANTGQYYKSYTILTGEITALATKIMYQFLISGTGAKNTSVGVVDFDLFMTNDDVVEPYFLFYMINNNGLAKNTFGEYSNANKVTSVSWLNLWNGLKGLYSIKGIENFTEVKTISIKEQAMPDLSPIHALTKLESFTLSSCGTLSLSTSDGKSIFENANNLNSVIIEDAKAVDNYLPIVYASGFGKNETKVIRTGLSNLKTLTIKPTLFYVSPECQLLDIIPVWNSALNNDNAYTGAKLRLFNWNADVTGTNIKNIADIANALIESAKTVLTVAPNGTKELTATIESASTTYNLNYRQDTDSRLKFSGAKITNDLTNVAIVDNIIPVIPYVSISLSGGTFIVYGTRNILLKNTTLPKVGSVELTLDEITARGITANNYTISNGKYLVPSDLLIPDGVLRNLLFVQFDANKNGIIEIDNNERARSIRISLNYEIFDITGIELFYNVDSWSITSKISRIPNLFWTNNEKNLQLNFSNNSFLKDLSALQYDADGDGSVYTSLSTYVTHLTFFGCNGLPYTELKYLKDFSKLTSINLNFALFSDYSDLTELAYNLSSLQVGERGFLVRNNIDTIRKMILESENKLNMIYQDGFNADGTPRIINNRVNLMGEGIAFEYVKFSHSKYTLDDVEYELPTDFRFLNKMYKLTYTVGTFDTHKVEFKNDKYYFTPVTPSNGELTMAITLESQVWNNKGTSTSEQWVKTYLENFPLILDIPYQPITDKYHTLDGFVQLTADGNASQFLLSQYVPDEFLRYYFFDKVDTNKDKSISYTELMAITDMLLDINNSLFHNISSFQGIGLLANLSTLNIWHAHTSDYSPIGELNNLKSLTINNAKDVLNDLTFLSNLTNLKELSFRNTHFIGLSGIESLDNLEKIDFATGTFQNKFLNILYIANSVAYAELDGKLYEVSLKPSDTAKKASLILNNINLSSSIINRDIVSNEALVLQDKVKYEQTDYKISYQVFSHNARLVDNVLTCTYDNYGKNAILLIARIEFEGEMFEKLFVLNVKSGGMI